MSRDWCKLRGGGWKCEFTNELLVADQLLETANLCQSRVSAEDITEDRGGGLKNPRIPLNPLPPPHRPKSKGLVKWQDGCKG